MKGEEKENYYDNDFLKKRSWNSYRLQTKLTNIKYILYNSRE